MSWVLPNTQKLRTIGPAGAPGKGMKYHVFIYFLTFCDFLHSSGEHIFGSIATVFAPNNVFRWGLIS